MVCCALQSMSYAAWKYGVPCPINGHDPAPELVARLAAHDWLAGRRAEGASIRRLADELGVGRTVSRLRTVLRPTPQTSATTRSVEFAVCVPLGGGV